MERGFIWTKDANLSHKELQVLRLVAEERTNQEIADEMGYSISHIEGMLGLSDLTRSIYAKIGVRRRAAAAVWFYNHAAAFEDQTEMPEGILQPKPASTPIEQPYVAQEAGFADRVFLDFIGSEENKVAWIHELSMTANTGLAIKMAKNSIAELRKALQHYPLARHRRDILEVHSRLLHLLCNAISVSQPPLQVWNSVLKLGKEQDKIREKTGDDTALGRVCYSLGDACSTMKQYDRARDYFSQALEYIKDEYWLMNIRRLLACNAAHRGDKTAAETEEGEMQRLLNSLDRRKLPTNWVVPVLEGLGRSQLLTGRREGWKTLEEAWRRIIKAKKQGEKVAYLELMYYRSSILGIKHLDPGNKERIQQLREQGLQRADEYGFGKSKYARVFQDALAYTASPQEAPPV